MKLGKTTITTIIPTFNRADFLGEALNSILNQTRIVDEIIVWDDGSTDHTEQVVRDCDSKIRYFRTENGGKSKALNAALAQASGDLIWICDDDDIALPDAAKILETLLANAPEAGLAAGSYQRFQMNAATNTPDFQGPGYWPDLSSGAPVRHVLEDIFLFQNATMVRRSSYDAVGPFREDLPRSIDYDMLTRLALRFPLVVTEEVLFHQRKHDGVRGPAAARHAAAQSDAVWKRADRTVFEGLEDQLSPDFFTRLFDSPDAAVRQRAGQLQRGCVWARRTDWERACDAFEAAAHLACDTRLLKVEQDICKRALAGKHGCAEILHPKIQTRLRALATGSGLGAEIANALIRGLPWRLRAAARAREIRNVVGYATLACRILWAAKSQWPAKKVAALHEHQALTISDLQSDPTR